MPAGAQSIPTFQAGAAIFYGALRLSKGVGQFIERIDYPLDRTTPSGRRIDASPPGAHFKRILRRPEAGKAGAPATK
jgi:hypothetical protein